MAARWPHPAPGRQRIQLAQLADHQPGLSGLRLSDQWSFANDRGVLPQFGARALEITRKFTNYLERRRHHRQLQLGNHTIEKKLPTTFCRRSVPASTSTASNRRLPTLARTSVRPPNFAYAPTNGNVTITNGVAVLTGDIKAETSINTDIGYRLQTKAITFFSATAFQVNFTDRQANAFDPNTLEIDLHQRRQGAHPRVELEAGTTPINGWSLYGSLTVQQSKVLNDIRTSATAVLPTTGSMFALTPRTMAGLALQYSNGPLYARLKAKKTGNQYATLMNDEEVPSWHDGRFRRWLASLRHGVHEEPDVCVSTSATSATLSTATRAPAPCSTPQQLAPRPCG